jgi:2-oxoglutarate dehydrogenase E1 component
MTPKSLLRNPKSVSSGDEILNGGFQFVLDDENPGTGQVDKLLFCSGKLYYDLAARKLELKSRNTALVRVEQLYPFPAEALRAILAKYKSARRVYWVQEETRNRGAWNYMRSRMDEELGIHKMSYIGRMESASPATGSHRRHLQEQESILQRAFDVKKKPPARVHSGAEKGVRSTR